MSINGKSKQLADRIEDCFAQGWRSRTERTDFVRHLIRGALLDERTAFDPSPLSGAPPPRTMTLAMLRSMLLAQADHLCWLSDRVKEAGITTRSIRLRAALIATAENMRDFVSSMFAPPDKDAGQKASDFKCEGPIPPDYMASSKARAAASRMAQEAVDRRFIPTPPVIRPSRPNGAGTRVVDESFAHDNRHPFDPAAFNTAVCRICGAFERNSMHEDRPPMKPPAPPQMYQPGDDVEEEGK